MRNLLKIIVILAWGFIFINLIGCEGGLCGCKDYKYRISQGGKTWLTNEIKEENGCVAFKMDNGDPVRICGDYAIEEDKDFKLPKDPKNRNH